VLDAALAIALREGVGAVTIGAVALEMGVTRPVVYACFADRVQMIDALLDREVPSLVRVVIDALHSSGGVGDPEQAFITGFQSLLTAVTSASATWRLVLGTEPDAALADRFREARADVTNQATVWIAPAMEHWWQTESLPRKMPVMIELFMASCESAVRTVLDDGNDWTAGDLGEFVGRAMYRAFRDA
jgi:AcrR family transcriptional regulator